MLDIFFSTLMEGFCTGSRSEFNRNIRFFVLVIKMLNSHLNLIPHKSSSAFWLCHFAILYILYLWLFTLLMNLCVWRLLLGFHSEVATLTAWGKFPQPSVYISAVFCSECRMKKFFTYNTHHHWLYNFTVDIVGSTLTCIKFTCLGYGMLCIVSPKWFFLKSQTWQHNALYITWIKKKSF